MKWQQSVQAEPNKPLARFPGPSAEPFDGQKISNTCYMCENPATSKEHIPPKCLFPEAKDLPGTDYRKNLISVPSCDVHNSHKSKDDEYLFFVLIAHFNNNPVAEKQFRTKILRALKRSPALLKIYKQKTQDVLLDGEPTMAFQFSQERVDKELSQMIRGLYFNATGNKWHSRIAIHSPGMFAFERPDAQFVNETTQSMASAAAYFFEDQRRKGDNPDVFWYQLHAEPENRRLLARMCFYDGLEILGLSDPKLKENVEQRAQPYGGSAGGSITD